MADRPILFSAPMVRALLAGTKTQTRRIIKPQPTLAPHHEPVRVEQRGPRGWVWMCHTDRPSYQFATGDWRAPVGVGDRLWVKETWRTYVSLDGTKPSELWSPSVEKGAAIFYEAGGDMIITRADTSPEREWLQADSPVPPGAGKVRVSIHMPRWASRLTLTVTDVRVERLQDISEADALAEGMTQETADAIMSPDELAMFASTHILCPDARGRILYEHIWDQINGKDSWPANPWAAAYTFTVERASIDQARLAA